MIGWSVKFDANLIQKVGPDSRAVKSAKYRNFGHAAASIRKTARASIENAPSGSRRGVRRRKGKIVARARAGASRPGQPPHTRRGALRNAILYDVNERSAIIGPRLSRIGQSGAVHEFGEIYKGTDYPERPYMGPALQASLGRFLDSWRGSIGE